MADIPNASEIGSLVWNSLPPQFSAGFSFMILLGKILGIAAIVYLLFLIIQSFVRIRQALRMKAIEQAVTEINKKMDMLIEHTKKGKKSSKG